MGPLKSDYTHDIRDGVHRIAVTYVDHKGQENQRAVRQTRLCNYADDFA
jgi:hypothetical protein